MRFSSVCYALILCLVTQFVFAAPVKTISIGAKAPDFSLKGVDDKTYTLETFADAKVLVVAFTCNHCPTAQIYEPAMRQFVTDYGPKGVAMVAISSNDPTALRPDELRFADVSDSFADMKIHAKRHKFNFPYIYDGDTQETAKAYGAKATPHYFVFDAERNLRYQGGFTDKEDPSEATKHHLKNAVDAILAGKEVPIANSKPWGCSTKWASKRGAVAAWESKWAARPVTLENGNLELVKALRKNDTNKLRLINLWATWCAPCVAEFPDLVHTAQVYEKRPFEMITISLDRENARGKAEAFLKKQHAAVKNIILPKVDKEELSQILDDKWEGPIPHTILVAPGGEIVYRHTGVIDPAELRQAIIGQLGRYWDHKKKK